MIIEARGLQPGIYFNLPETIYHSDPALSRGGIVDLLDTPNTYWRGSWMNKERIERAQSEDMAYGTAFHCMLLEPERFNRIYNIVGLDEWTKGERRISHKDYFKIVESIKVLRAGKDSKRFLSNGIGEVTIVHDDPLTEMRFRTRHDYFTPLCSVDYKTARALHERYLMNEFRDRGLDVQMKLYRQARIEFKKQYKAGKASVFGQIDPGFFKKFLENEMDEFVFIFQRKTEPYPFEMLFPEDDTENSGEDKITKAADIYRKYLQLCGTNPWPVCEGKVRPFSMYYGFR